MNNIQRYSVNSEGNYIIDSRNSDIDIVKKIYSILKQYGLTAEEVYTTINVNNRGHIKSQQIEKYFLDLGIQLSDMDLFAFLRCVDPT